MTSEKLFKKSPLESAYKVFTKTNDQRFGEILILQRIGNQSDYIMAKKKQCREIKDCERDVFQARERMKLNHPCLMDMLDFSCSNFSDKANNDFEIIGYYEYPPMDLESEIAERTKSRNFFTSHDLLKLLENVLSGLVYLKSFKMIHSDVRPKFISLPRDEMTNFKLLDRLGEPISPSKVQINNFKKGKCLYVSPSLYEAIANNKPKIRHNPYKSDAFSLGLVLLECGLLKSIQGIYNKSDKIINTQELVSLQDEFMAKYSDNEILKQSIFWLLNVDESERKDAKFILKMFQNSDLSKTDQSKILDVSQSNHSQTEILRPETQKIFSDQSVQCEKELIVREESSIEYLRDGLIQANKPNFSKQSQPVIIIPEIKNDIENVSKVLNYRSFDASGNVTYSKKENTHFSNQLEVLKKNVVSEQKTKSINASGFQCFAKIDESSGTENLNQVEKAYSFRNSINQDANAKNENYNYHLVKNKSETDILLSSNQKPDTIEKNLLTLENSNFITNNRTNLEDSSAKKGSDKKFDFFDFKIDTPQKNSDFFQFSGQKMFFNAETPSFNRNRDQVNRNPIQPQVHFSPKKNLNSRFDSPSCKFIDFGNSLPNQVIVLPANVHVQSPYQIPRESFTSSPANRFYTYESSRGSSQVIYKRESNININDRSKTPPHVFPESNRSYVTVKKQEVEKNDFYRENEQRESLLNNLKSNVSDNQQNVTKEIYLSPLNYKKMQESSKIIQNKSDFMESDPNNNDIATYNYEITKTGQNSKQYVFKRNASFSVLQNTSKRNSEISSRQTIEKICFNPETNDSLRNINSIDQNYISQRYGQVQLRLGNPNYQVYRKIDREVEKEKLVENRSHSCRIIRSPDNIVNRHYYVESKL